MDTPEYDFLKTNPHLGDRIIFLTFGGSWSYGTNVEGSDVDIRGCALNSKEDLIGLSNFEQVVNEQTDTTVYGFNKLIQLLMNCNPNTIEMLGCKPEHYFVMTDIGQELVNNRKLFLSQAAVNSFGGYAHQQLARLQSALARNSNDEADIERRMKQSLEFHMKSFHGRFKEIPQGAIELKIDTSDKTDCEQEIFMKVNLDHYPLRDYKGMWSEMNNIVKEYGKINHRNRKHTDLKLNKHSMHLIRLYLMCLDILEKEEINTYRKKDRDMLLEIRNGKYQNEDGSYQSEFFELLEEYESRLKYAKENTSLPKRPDHKMVEEFVMSVNERVVKGDY